MRTTFLAVLVTFVAASAAAQGWRVFRSDRFGFGMLVAPGTEWTARDFGNGWGGITAEKGVFEFVALCKMKEHSDAAKMEQTAVAVTGIPADAWSKVDEGVGRRDGLGAHGWSFWRTYLAKNSRTHRMVYAVLGYGPRGSYLLLLGTTEADYVAHERLYQQWYQSLTVF
jgi:hypothetical protein